MLKYLNYKIINFTNNNNNNNNNNNKRKKYVIK